MDCPLTFTFAHTVSGPGFVARVTLTGRALARREDDGLLWVYGVRPGAVAACGPDLAAACREHRDTCAGVLDDAAEGASDFDGFEIEAERFVLKEDAVERARWDAAVEALRSGTAHPEPWCDALPKERRGVRTCGVRAARLDSQTVGPTASVHEERGDYRIADPG